MTGHELLNLSADKGAFTENKLNMIWFYVLLPCPPTQLQVAAKPMEPVQGGQSRGTSTLRPPAMRLRGGIAGTIKVLSQGRGSNIPRPASRIPPPRIR